MVVLSTNTMIDMGFIIANLVPYLLLQIFTEERLEWVWRLTLGLGAVVSALICLSLRLAF